MEQCVAVEALDGVPWNPFPRCWLQLPKRLARRLMDLQFLPYIVVTNPHIKRVYESYYHAFSTLRALPPPQTIQDNAGFSALLVRLVNEHGEWHAALS